MGDRISDLPDNVIDNILSRVPLLDAVRTSILSTKWRFHWTRCESLVLDCGFFCDVLDCEQEDEVMASTYASIVANIILSHTGLIRKFVLLVPDFGNTPAPGAINLWIHAALRRGVQDSKLQYEYNLDNKCPSSVFQCTELKHLALLSVELELPLHDFGKLSSLLSLDLCCYMISEDMLTNIFLNCPLLESFLLDYSNIELDDGPFFISAPKLELLSISNYSCTDFVLKNIPNMCSLSLTRYREYKEDVNMFQDIVDFFGAVPKVEIFSVTGTALAQWLEQDVPERLPVPLKNHWSFTINDMDMHSLAQIRSMFCLIKSSPKLQTLEISMYLPQIEPHDSENHLQSQVRDVENLWSLRTVKLTHLMGYDPEITLIEIILLRCPMLEKLYLSSNSGMSSTAEYTMMTNIMRMRRASTQAEVIYSKLA